METPEDIFVVMLERDMHDNEIDNHPQWKQQRVIVETPEDNFSLKGAHGLKRRWEGYGEIKIGRVIFGDLDQIIPTRAANDLLLPDNKKLDDLIDTIDEIISDHDGLPVGEECRRAQFRLEILKWVRNL